jgi:ADP-ribose pyrophosphatase YjhB (NUDIX family)
MPELGVAVVVIRDDAILLTKREDFDVWCLPGGAVDACEPLDYAAQREVREETGLEIAITRLIGICTKPFWGATGTHSIVFAAVPQTDQFNPAPTEVTALGYFGPDDLPEPLLWEHHHYIQAARTGQTGLLWQNMVRTPPLFANRMALYQWRDTLGIPRQQAYHLLMQQMDSQTMHLLIGTLPHDTAQHRSWLEGA